MDNNIFAGYGKTVYGDSFVGRELQISIIKQRCLSSEFGNLSIVGLPKIGKSSLMYHSLMLIKEELWRDRMILPLWLSVKSYKEPIEFYHKLVLSVYTELKHLKINDQLLSLLNEYIGLLKDPHLAFVELEHYLLSFFTEISINKIRILICLDEFDYAKDVFDEVHYQLLRTLSYEPGHQIGFITTSRRSIFDIERYSGQGSNFFGTFENIRLGVFSDDETSLLFKKAKSFPLGHIMDVKSFTGNHPYLNSMFLYKFIQSDTDSIDKVIDDCTIEFLNYFDDVFRVLEKDNLADKLIRIYSGILEGVSKSEEEYLMKYGLFISDEDYEFVPFSNFFNSYLTIKWRQSPFKLIWPEAEKSLRNVITDCLDHIYGDDWEELIKIDLPKFSHPEDYDFINSLQKRRTSEKRNFGVLASNNLIDQLYPRHYPILIEMHWDEFYSEILDVSLDYWIDNLEFIAKRVRNPEFHSRSGLLTDREMQKASLICSEIIDKVSKWYS